MGRTHTFTRVEGFNRALRSLSKEASAELREESLPIAADIADKAASRARKVGGPATLVAPTIRPRKDRIPKVVAGGTGKAGLVLMGAEFGGRGRPTTMQFDPWVPLPGTSGSVGYFLTPTAREEGPAAVEAYGDALMRAVDRSAGAAR